MGQNQQLDPQEIREFVRDYLEAVGENDVRSELGFYADKVGYYHNGPVDRRIIERTLRDYYQRWPKRAYSLGHAVEYSRNLKRGEITVTFRVNFSLKSRGQRIEGATDNRFIINAATTDPRIVDIQETRVRG